MRCRSKNEVYDMHYRPRIISWKKFLENYDRFTIPGIKNANDYLFPSPTTSLFSLSFRNPQITTLDIIPTHIFQHKHQILILLL
jgi:hypothetical protein